MKAPYTGFSRIRFGSIITTYRCNAKCNMCDIWRNPTKPSEEVGIEVYEKLPVMDAANITGGEPFLRKDLDDIVTVIKRRARRVVISSNGWHVERTIKLFEKHGNSIGLRISIEGLPKTNDEIRGMRDGFDRAVRILTTLDRMGIKDIGFGLTIQDWNAHDAIELFQLARMMRVEFASAALHNSFYFHKHNNQFADLETPINTLSAITKNLLESWRPKNWFRAYFNYGLMNYLKGNPRLLPCRMAHDAFFIEPNGDILPCNAMDRPMPFGNLKEQSWQDIWYSEGAERVRETVRTCPKNCWMVGSVSQEMKKNPIVPMKWIARHKFLRRPIQVPQQALKHPNNVYSESSDLVALSMSHATIARRNVRERNEGSQQGEKEPEVPQRIDDGFSLLP